MYGSGEDTLCSEENNLDGSFSIAIAMLLLSTGLFFGIISPRGLGKYLHEVSMRMETVSDSSTEEVEDEEEEEEEDGSLKPRFANFLAIGSLKCSKAFKCLATLPAGVQNQCLKSLKCLVARPDGVENRGCQRCIASLKAMWRSLERFKFCTPSNPVCQLGRLFWNLIPEWFLLKFQIEAPIDLLLLFGFPPLFCVGYLLFDLFTMLLDVFLIINSLGYITWVVPSFPTVAIVMGDIDFTLERFLIDVKLVCSVDVLFLAKWWKGFSKALAGFSNWARAAMEGAEVTCEGATMAVSFAYHVVLLATMVSIIESHAGYVMRFSGAEHFSKYILGKFHSSRATKLASKGTKVAAGKLKVRATSCPCFSPYVSHASRISDSVSHSCWCK